MSIQMKKLTNFISQKFVGAFASESSEAKLSEWLNDMEIHRNVKYSGAPLDPNERFFHTTVIYSSNKIKLAEIEHFMGDGILVKPTGFDLYGPNKDIPVMKLEVDGPLKIVRESILSQYSIEEKFPNWSPHISLSYDGYDRVPEALPDFEIKLNLLKISS